MNFEQDLVITETVMKECFTVDDVELISINQSINQFSQSISVSQFTYLSSYQSNF